MSIDPKTARTVNLHESGLLWLINTAILHPRGYALAVETNAPLMVTLLGDGTEPVMFTDSMETTIQSRFEAVERLLRPPLHVAGGRVIVDEDRTPEAGAALLGVVPTLPEDEPTVVRNICPECAQGKHPNCTVEMLDVEDRTVLCDCRVTGHFGEGDD